MFKVEYLTFALIMRRIVLLFSVFIVTAFTYVDGYLRTKRPIGFDEEFENSVQKGKFLCLFLGVCSVSFQQGSAAKPNLDTVFQWSQLEFDYESEYDRQADIDMKVFIPGQPAPIDTDVYYSEDNRHNKIFVTIPRFQPGLPVALGTVSSKMYKGNPVITPYPSWKWHRSPQSCATDRLVSVYRVLIDECDRLWVLDTGKLLEEQTCPPQIMAFDLKTNQLIHRYDIPSKVLESRSTLVTPIVDIRNKQCGEAFVYIADCQTYSIIVHNVKTGAFWQVTDKTMYPYPNYGTFNIKGDSFDLMDGVLGMTLEQYNPSGDRRLFYHALSSPTENYVYTSHLRNQSLFMHDPTSSPQIFYTYRGERRTQSAAEAIDKNGVIFFGLMSDVKIACWNTKGEYGDRLYSDIVASDPVTLQFASGVKVVKNRKGIQELWILTSRFQKVAADTLSTSEVNFRILAGKVDDLLFGTNCKGKKHNVGVGGGGGGGGGYGLITTPRG